MLRNVVIPGGTGGLGGAVTRRLIKDGWRCFVPWNVESEAQFVRSTIPPHQRDQIVLVETDMLAETGVAGLLEVVAEHGALDALVHLIGGVRAFVPVAETTVADWDALLSLNLRSLFLTSRRAMELFARQGHGRIVTIGAMAAVKPAERQGAYAVAKAGVVALTKILADEGRAFGVTANCIAPGILATEANLAWGSEKERATWTSPDDVASMIAHLLGEDAGSINGSVIQMFGGMNV